MLAAKLESTPPPVAPGPKGIPLVGNLPEFQRKRHLYIEELWRKYGDVVGLKLGPLPVNVLVRPEHVRRVLVDNKDNYVKGRGFRSVRMLLGNGLFVSEGEFWQKQRRMMQPPFTAKSVPQFTESMIESTLDMLERWEGFAARDESFEMNYEMTRITLSIIGKTMLGIDLATEGPAVSAALIDVLKFIGNASFRSFGVPLYVPTPGNVRFRKALATLDEIVHKIIRNQQAAPKHNLLTMLIDARDPETGTGMTPQQLRDEIITIFLAGHETTAIVLTWTWYLLSQYPDAEKKLHAELETVVAGRIPTAADLPKLVYCKMVVEEAMRLYPPVWMFPRDAVADDEIGGYKIPKGTILLLCQFLAQRHPDYWENPEVFDPERFAPEKAGLRSQMAYYPFGMGPRTCIGNHFAIMEAQLVLAIIAQKFRPRPLAGQDIRPQSMATFRPAHGIHMKLERR